MLFYLSILFLDKIENHKTIPFKIIYKSEINDII